MLESLKTFVDQKQAATTSHQVTNFLITIPGVIPPVVVRIIMERIQKGLEFFLAGYLASCNWDAWRYERQLSVISVRGLGCTRRPSRLKNSKHSEV
jgi:hypothetical protein